jgi:putative ABC transport system ATP-binding protein
VLQGRDLTKTFRSGEVESAAVRGISLEVGKGSFVAIMGPSGCGKSTLLNLLAGLDRPDSGEVYVAGERIDTMTETQLALFRRRHMGMIFQFFHLIQGLSVAANIELPGLLAGMPKQKIRSRRDELAEMLGITKLLHKGVSQLSGGEQQRVAVARAVLIEPTILMADEPTGALDQATTQQVLQLLRTLNQGGQTILMVTHDATVAAAADYTITIKDGRRTDLGRSHLARVPE